MNKFSWMVPFINWKKCGDFETKTMIIIPFFLYIYKRQYITENIKEPEKNNIQYAWGCYITPFLSFSFQFGWYKKK